MADKFHSPLFCQTQLVVKALEEVRVLHVGEGKVLVWYNPSIVFDVGWLHFLLVLNIINDN